jgi:PAS domain S-box-containing protein
VCEHFYGRRKLFVDEASCGLLQPSNRTLLPDFQLTAHSIHGNVRKASLPVSIFSSMIVTRRLLMTEKHMVAELKQKIRDLEQQAAGQTAELIAANRALKNEIETRKKAERALSESEKRYRLISRLTSDFAYAFRVDQGSRLTYQWATGALTRITGFTAEDLASRGGWMKLVHPDDTPLIQEQLKSVMTGLDSVVEYRIISKDKQIRWMRDYTRPEIDPDDGRINHVYGAVQDITEQKTAQEALRLTQFATDHSSDPAFWMGPDARFFYVNDAACRSLGYSREELLNMRVHDIDPDFQEDIWPDHWKEVKQRGAFMMESKHRAKDGHTFPVEITVNYLAFEGREYNCAFARDITERRENQKALEESHNTLLTVLDSINATIYVAEIENHEIIFMNKHMQDCFGGNMAGEKCWRVFRDESGPCAHCTNSQLLDDNGRPAGVIAWEGRNPLTGKWYINYDRAIRWTDGRYVHLQIATDITQIKEYEIQRKNTEAQLRQSQKMEAIGTLAGGIAHDFNNILSAIIGYAELAVNDPESQRLSYYLQEVIKAGERASDLVRQILTFSRKGDQEHKPVQISSIVKEALKFLRSSLPTTISIHQQISADRYFVMADPTQIHQIVMNICTNAAHAMRGEGGTLGVELKNVDLDLTFTADYPDMSPGHFVELTVHDTGHGMPENILESIFDPYFTTKDKGEGTGLGLSVVQGIVKSCGGEIIANSQLGEGSTFTIYLPAIPMKEGEAPKMADSLPRGDETVLFVDDEHNLVEIGRKMLGRLGYRVITAVSSPEALNRFKDNSEEIDLVITDMTMPEMTGDRLAREIMAVRPDVPIIICTGYSDAISETSAMALGLKGFVMKPLVMEKLATTVRSVLDRAKAGP